MARNHEKQYGRLNRLFLLKEKEEFEKANPTRPKLDLLDTPEEIQKWIPSIKKDIDFYLKKSKVPCYSDQQIADCNLKIIQLEKEFKAFIRKIKKLTPGVLDVIPWTSRPYKKKKLDSVEAEPQEEFAPIATPLLNEIKGEETNIKILDSPSMNEPLIFNPASMSNLNSNQFYSSEIANVNIAGLESNSEVPSRQNIRENVSFNNSDSTENEILYPKYNEAFSMCFKSNSLLNDVNNVLPSLLCEKRSFSYGLGDTARLSIMGDPLDDKRESHKKRLRTHTPSNQDIVERVNNLSEKECEALDSKNSNSEQSHSPHVKSDSLLEVNVGNEKNFENKNSSIDLSEPVKSSNQLSMKLVDYNCSDSESYSE